MKPSQDSEQDWDFQIDYHTNEVKMKSVHFVTVVLYIQFPNFGNLSLRHGS